MSTTSCLPLIFSSISSVAEKFESQGEPEIVLQSIENGEPPVQAPKPQVPDMGRLNLDGHLLSRNLSLEASRSPTPGFGRKILPARSPRKSSRPDSVGGA